MGEVEWEREEREMKIEGLSERSEVDDYTDKSDNKLDLRS